MHAYPRFLGGESEVGVAPRVSILSAPLAATVSWGGGTDQGPRAILDASPALEVFDDELLQETVLAGIETLPPLDVAGCSQETACERICRAVGEELRRGRFPVLLGGEHSVTTGAVAALLRHYPDLHVVQVDAHLDLRDSYEENPLSHAAIMRRLDDLAIPFSQVGIRSFSREEWLLVQERGWQPFFMRRIRQEADWIAQVCANIKGPVYLTVDVDGLDPSIMPATGTPEPDGMSWAMAVDLIRTLVREKNLVGMDVVEFAPRPGAEHAAFLAAKLIYRTLGYLYAPVLAGQGGRI
ncbi:MAG: agmatinase [Thermodesulfobacteriota bacterium]